MAILIDADVIIEAERGNFDLANWLTSQPNEEFMLAAITIAELWHGVERATGNRRAQRLNFLVRLASIFEIVDYSQQTALEHARLWAELESRGQTIGAHDMILAATALEQGHAVATFNQRHFALVPSLKVIAPL